MIDYLVLGSLAVLADDEPVDIGSTRQRVVLAVLLLDANRVVSRDRLVDALWDHNPPATARSQIHICVSALRRKLAAHGAPDIIETAPPGYLIRVDDRALDVRKFEALVASGRAATAAGRPHEAAHYLAAALELWRAGARRREQRRRPGCGDPAERGPARGDRRAPGPGSWSSAGITISSVSSPS